MPTKRINTKPEGVQMMTTAVHIRRDHWELLRGVAYARAMASGGRPSVSAVLGELVEANRAKLEKAQRQ